MVPRPTPSTHAEPPLGLTAWRERLAAVDLPLLSPRPVVRELLSDNVSMATLLDVLQRDLPLGLAVLLEGQKQLRRGQIESLSHAAGALGLERIQALIRRLASRPLDPSQPGHREYAEAMATSRLAAQLAAHFAPNDTPDQRQRKMWEMQVQMMAEWRLPLAAPSLAQAMAQRIAAGERPAQVEQALLGCQMHTLNAAMALDAGLLEADDPRATQPLDLHRLGQAARLAWTHAGPPPLPHELERWRLQPTTLPALLHLLAQEAMRSWHSPRTRLLQNALSAHRQWPLNDVVAATRHAAVAASRDLLTRGVLVPPAARLLWAPGRRPKRSMTPPTHSIERGSPARQLIDHFVDDCAHGRHASLGAFFQAFQRTLAEGLDLQRFALFLKTSQAEQLVCFMARGFGPAVVPRQYVVTLADGNLLAKVFGQPHGFLWGQGERLPSLRQRLPSSLRAELLAGGAIWGAVQVHDRSVGVLWADAGPSATPLDDTQYTGFKLVCRHFGDALTRLMKQQQAQQRATAPSSGG